MKISIVTVCFNSEKTIEQAITSVLNQTYQDIEYIIIDGGSKDNTLSIIEKYNNKIAKVISEKDNGIYDAMNKGITNATGDYIFFLNSDDYLFSNDAVENIFSNIKTFPDIIYGDLALKHNEKISIKKQNKFNKIYLMKNVPAQPTMFFKKNVFQKCGNFRTDYKIVSDYEWILKAFLEFKISSQYIPVTINVFNTGGVSTSKAHDELHNKERNEVLNKYFTPVERLIYDFISKYFRSLTDMPVISDLLNLFFKFKL